MRKCSEAFKEAIRKRVTPFSCKIVDINNNSFVLTNENVISIQINEDLITSDTFELGNFCTRTATIELVNSNYGNLEGKRFQIYIGIQLINNNNVEYLKIGTFRCVSHTNKDNIATLECEDYSTLFDVTLDQTKISYPISLKNLLIKVCNQIGVSLYDNNFLNHDYIIQEDPKLNENTTCRQVVAMIAELAGGYAKINDDGKLEIFNLEKNNIYNNFTGDPIAYIENDINTGVIADNLIDRNLYFELESNQNQTSMITKVSMLVDNIFMDRGNDTGKNYIIDNKLIITHENRELLKSIYEKIVGLCYTTLDLQWIGDTSYELGDNIVVYDGKRYYSTYIMHQTLNYNGGLTSSISATGLTKEQELSMNEGYIEQEIKRAKVQIDFLDESINMAVKSDELESIVTQNAGSWNLAINGVMEGTNYSFDGTGATFTNGDLKILNQDEEVVLWCDEDSGRLSTNSLEVFGDGDGTVNLHGNGTKHIDFRSDDNKGLFLNFYRGQTNGEDAHCRLGVYPADSLSDRSNQFFIEPDGRNGKEPQVVVRGINSDADHNEEVQFNVFGEIVAHGQLAIRHGDNKMNILDMIQDIQSRLAVIEAQLGITNN